MVQHSTETEAVKEIESQLAKSPRRGAAKAEAEADGEVEGEGDIDDIDDTEDDGGATVANEAA